jgi:fibronectin-binding autotransporter adhesin
MLYGFAPPVSPVGTIFEVDRGSGAITTRYRFGGTDGTYPYAGLLLDSKGNLYGTTSAGGAGYYGGVFNSGTVFELSGGATDQWTGANFAVDTNWSDGANWSLGTPPIAGQPVLFTNNSSVKAFTSTVDAGFTNSIGALRIDSTWGGTITVNTALSVAANFSLASGSFGGSGAVTIAGAASQWTGGQIVLGAGGFTNTGTLNADTSGSNRLVIGPGTLTNDGTINEAGNNSLILEGGAALYNAGWATFDLTANGSVSQSGGGSFTNAGTLEKTGGTGTSTISTTTLSNTGTIAVTSGTLNISAAVAQVSGTTLTAGAWTVTGSSTVHSTLDITSAGSLATLGSAAQVTLSGPNTGFSNLAGLNTIASGASFSLLGGQSFTTTGALTNNGSLTLSPGSILTVGGSFTQTSTGTLTIELGGTNKKPTFGQLVSSTGNVALGGSLNVTSTVVPAVGSAFELLENGGNSAVSGIFAGLAEGATFTVTVGTTKMTFQITYAGKVSGGKHNVVVTRIS